jgi:hypothetical protein
MHHIPNILVRREARHVDERDRNTGGFAKFAKLERDDIIKGVTVLHLEQGFGPLKSHSRSQSTIQAHDDKLIEQLSSLLSSLTRGEKILQGIDLSNRLDLLLLNNASFSTDDTFKEALKIGNNWRRQALSLHEFSRLS